MPLRRLREIARLRLAGTDMTMPSSIQRAAWTLIGETVTSVRLVRNRTPVVKPPAVRLWVRGMDMTGDIAAFGPEQAIRHRGSAHFGAPITFARADNRRPEDPARSPPAASCIPRRSRIRA